MNAPRVPYGMLALVLAAAVWAGLAAPLLGWIGATLAMVSLLFAGFAVKQVIEDGRRRRERLRRLP